MTNEETGSSKLNISLRQGGRVIPEDPSLRAGTWQIFVRNLKNDSENRKVIKKFIVASLCVVFVPILTYYAMKNLILDHFHMQAQTKSLVSGAAACIVNMVVTIVYVVMAFGEEDERLAPASKKED